ncbi:protein of unknown function [Modestobacter italicus]|uniref:Uncharacterized protein n=1 Tax=Modestobacter italicus (strain DSM 44449 / CECT 9708 / BC 501) TaxID=2732864 RepID=I4ERF5_MODI5|nr:protein of unknown function [Modestobacter marinus]
MQGRLVEQEGGFCIAGLRNSGIQCAVEFEFATDVSVPSGGICVCLVRNPATCLAGSGKLAQVLRIHDGIGAIDEGQVVAREGRGSLGSVSPCFVWHGQVGRA